MVRIHWAALPFFSLPPNYLYFQKNLYLFRVILVLSFGIRISKVLWTKRKKPNALSAKFAFGYRFQNPDLRTWIIRGRIAFYSDLISDIFPENMFLLKEVLAQVILKRRFPAERVETLERDLSNTIKQYLRILNICRIVGSSKLLRFGASWTLG